MKKILLSLSLVTVALAGKAQTLCSDLFISEYVEGSGNSKAIEIYNPTNASISLSNYRLVRYSNGSAIGTDSTDFTATMSIASYSTFVICNGTGVTSGTTATSPACSPALMAISQQTDGAYPNPTAMNGDDALVLVRKSPYAHLDIFGKIGEQPATAWSDVAPYDGTAGKWWTKDHSMQRKQTIKNGVMTNPTAFNVKLEWDSLPKDNWTKLGSHVCDCKPVNVKEIANSIYVKMYPNPANGNEVAFVSDKAITEITIVSAIGQVVLTNVSIKEENTIVLRNLGLAKGLYYTTIKTVAGSKTEKLIIQ